MNERAPANADDEKRLHMAENRAEPEGAEKITGSARPCGRWTRFRKWTFLAAVCSFCVGVLLAGANGLRTEYRSLQLELENVAAYRSEAELTKLQAKALEHAIAELRVTFNEEHKRQLDTIARLNRLYDTLRSELGFQEARLIEVTAAKSVADLHQDRLNEELRERDDRIALLIEQKAQKIDELRHLGITLASVSAERDSALAVGERLERELLALEIRLRETETQRQQAEVAFREWVENQIETIETALWRNGVDADRLMDRALNDSGLGQGGPLMLEEPESNLPELPIDALPLDDIVGRLQAAQRLVLAAPLLPPIAAYQVTSAYGDRRDPLTGRRAFHPGLDVAAPRGSEVVATASGKVLRAGRVGAYGIMVEIDHGMGITTHYAHLKELRVKAGEEVTFHQTIGVIGNTGRSTGRHLHYEIRLDKKPLNPASFIDAGRELAASFRS